MNKFIFGISALLLLFGAGCTPTQNETIPTKSPTTAEEVFSGKWIAELSLNDGTEIDSLTLNFLNDDKDKITGSITSVRIKNGNLLYIDEVQLTENNSVRINNNNLRIDWVGDRDDSGNATFTHQDDGTLLMETTHTTYDGLYSIPKRIIFQRDGMDESGAIVAITRKHVIANSSVKQPLVYLTSQFEDKSGVAYAETTVHADDTVTDPARVYLKKQSNEWIVVAGPTTSLELGFFETNSLPLEFYYKNAGEGLF